MTRDEIIAAWCDQADYMNQWETLGEDEKLEWAMKLEREALGGGLAAIKTLLSRDPCVHANTAIEMIDAILKEHQTAQRPWVGLTDEARTEIRREHYARTLPLMDAVESKLKELNT